MIYLRGFPQVLEYNWGGNRKPIDTLPIILYTLNNSNGYILLQTQHKSDIIVPMQALDFVFSEDKLFYTNGYDEDMKIIRIGSLDSEAIGCSSPVNLNLLGVKFTPLAPNYNIVRVTWSKTIEGFGNSKDILKYGLPDGFAARSLLNFNRNYPQKLLIYTA